MSVFFILSSLVSQLNFFCPSHCIIDIQAGIYARTRHYFNQRKTGTQGSYRAALTMSSSITLSS